MTTETEHDRIAGVEDGSASTYVTLELGEQILGIEVRHVREILDMQKITPLPNAPMDILGVVDVRGVSIPVVDLKSRLGISPVATGQDERIVVIEIPNGSGRKPLGILADKVRNVDQITPEQIEPCSDMGIGQWDSRVLNGLSRQNSDLIVLVNIDRIFGGSADEFDLASAAGY